MQSRMVLIVTLALSTLLFACSGEKSPHERLAGVWDRDDKASWEYQKPGVPYESTIAELRSDISLHFDIKEQTCLALNAFGGHLFRYRVVTEEKDRVTLVIGENTFAFEFKTDGRMLLYLPDDGVESSSVLTRGETSVEAEAGRMAKAESRLAAIVKMHTENVVSRTKQFLIGALLDPGVRVTDADMFRLYAAEIDAFEKGQSKATEQPPEGIEAFMNAMLRDVVLDSNVRYANIYTSKGTLCLSSEVNASQPSAMQREYILNAAKTGKSGPIALVSSGDERLFELYLPFLKPVANGEKDVVGVLAIARPMFPLPEKCLTPDVSIPDGNLYFIRFAGQNFEVIGGSGFKVEIQALDLNDAGEIPFARRESFAGNGMVCSQASHGPVANSWVLFETSCPSGK
ncbi:MAG: hypothetical protein DELT_02224 [Desulfovibrio sp.]